MYQFRYLHPNTPAEWVILVDVLAIAMKLRGKKVIAWREKTYPSGFCPEPTHVFSALTDDGEVLQFQADGRNQELEKEITAIRSALNIVTVRAKKTN